MAEHAYDKIVTRTVAAFEPLKFMERPMDLHEQRMQCLKMAFDLGGKPETVLSAAQQLLDFISGASPTVDAKITDQATATNALVTSETVPDPIAACGTALVMQEGGELADAVATADPLPAAAEPVEAACADPSSSANETVSVIETPEEGSTELVVEEASADASDSVAAAETDVLEASPSIDPPIDHDATAVPANCEEHGEPTASIN